MRKICAIGLMLLMAVGSVMAAGSGESGAKGPVELTIWMGSWWSEKAPLITAEFQKLYPNYKLKIDTLPINGYFDNAAAAILSGSGPDILDIDITQVATFASKNLLTDITADVGSKLKADDFIKTSWEFSHYKGKMYGMPNRGTGGVYYYNKNMFDEAGVPYPQDNWNFDDMLAKAKKITVPGQKYGVGIAADLSDPNNVWSSFAPVLWAFGGEFMNADYTKATLDTPNAIKGITFWVELLTKHKVVPEGSVGFTISRDVVPLLSANKVAMLPFGVSGAMTFEKGRGSQVGCRAGARRLQQGRRLDLHGPGLLQAQKGSCPLPPLVRQARGPGSSLRHRAFERPCVGVQRAVEHPAVPGLSHGSPQRQGPAEHRQVGRSLHHHHQGAPEGPPGAEEPGAGRKGHGGAGRPDPQVVTATAAGPREGPRPWILWSRTAA